MYILRSIFEKKGCKVEGKSSNLLCHIVAAYGQDEKLPEQLIHWIKGLHKTDARKLYRRCREKGVMPEAVLVHIDDIIESVEQQYKNDQARKGRPVLSAREKYTQDQLKKFKDIRFFLETRERIQAGTTQKAATGSESKARKYRKLKRQYDWIVCKDIDGWLAQHMENNFT